MNSVMEHCVRCTAEHQEEEEEEEEVFGAGRKQDSYRQQR